MTSQEKQELLKRLEPLKPICRLSDAIKQGVPKNKFYTFKRAGIVEKVASGVYKINAFEEEENIIMNPELLTSIVKMRGGVVCLLSALSIHELTTEVPHRISIAIEQGNKPSTIVKQLPIKTYHFSHEAYNIGIEKKEIDGKIINVYDPEKTIVDCVKFRHKLGQDIVLEAIKLYSRGKTNMQLLMKYAKICRVEKIITPYLEIIL